MQYVYFCIAIGVMLLPFSVAAQSIPSRYTNDNFLSSYHEAPASFQTDDVGGFYGYTVSGRLFTQKPVANQYNVRLHRFVIDDAFFYISDRGIIFADTDIAAVSMYFTRSA